MAPSGSLELSEPDRQSKVLRPRDLIRVDWMAGAAVGLLMLALRGWLAELFALPLQQVTFMGIANLAYASVSFTLARLSGGSDHVPFLRVIAVANMAWASLCVVWAVMWFGKASIFGLGQFVAEAFFVGGLGILEWRAGGQRAVAPKPSDGR